MLTSDLINFTKEFCFFSTFFSSDRWGRACCGVQVRLPVSVLYGSVLYATIAISLYLIVLALSYGLSTPPIQTFRPPCHWFFYVSVKVSSHSSSSCVWCPLSVLSWTFLWMNPATSYLHVRYATPCCTNTRPFPLPTL